MQEEGAIKFDLRFNKTQPSPVPDFDALNHWRDALWERALIGQDPVRYGGYGFGNVSQRIGATNDRMFIISGSQTGGLEHLGLEHYATVTYCDPASNRVDAHGPIEPSSESLTHDMVYLQSDTIRAVLHVHSPDIWPAAHSLDIPVTDADVEYGTAAMAEEVDRLFRETDVARRKIFSMGGHEDGIVSFGTSAEEAGIILVDTLAQCKHI